MLRKTSTGCNWCAPSFKSTSLNKTNKKTLGKFPQVSKNQLNRFLPQEDRFAPQCAGCFTSAARAVVAVAAGSQLRSGAADWGQVHWPTDRRPAAEDALKKKKIVCFYYSMKRCAFFLVVFVFLNFLPLIGSRKNEFTRFLQLQI